MKALILGSAGQLGQAFLNLYGDDAIGYDIELLDIRERDRIRTVLDEREPEVVINCAAVQQLEWCEAHPAETFETNVIAVDMLARDCAKRFIPFVTMSSSYIFNGIQRRAYTEDDLPRALSVYGVSKLAVEHLVPARSGSHYVCRLTNMYGGTPVKGKTFIDRILDQAKAGETPMITDAMMSPSLAADNALAIKWLIEHADPGTYNVASGNPVSLHFFVIYALARMGLPQKVDLVKHEDVLRPRNSSLDISRLLSTGHTPRSSTDALAAYLASKYGVGT